MTLKQWTAEETASLHADWTAGVPMQELVRKHRRTSLSIDSKRLRMNLPARMPFHSQETKDRVRAALAAGASMHEAGRLVGLSFSQVRNIARRLAAPRKSAAPAVGDRLIYGWEPLPPGHPVSWSAIQIGGQSWPEL